MFDNLQHLFINEHGSFFKSLQFQSIVIFTLVMIFFTVYFPKSYGFVIILLTFAFFIANSYVTVSQNKLNDFNHKTLIKLQKLQNACNQSLNNQLNIISNSNFKTFGRLELQRLYNSNKLDSLYIDADIIHFLESILPLSKYNEFEFYLLLKTTNNILKIKQQIDTYYEANQTYPENTSELFEISNDIKSKAINHLHNFIYTIPRAQSIRSYLRDIIDKYSILINRVTDSIYTSYQNNIKQKGINTSTKFVSYNETKPFDSQKNHSLSPQTQNQLISFYI